MTVHLSHAPPFAHPLPTSTRFARGVSKLPDFRLFPVTRLCRRSRIIPLPLELNVSKLSDSDATGHLRFLRISRVAARRPRLMRSMVSRSCSTTILGFRAIGDPETSSGQIGRFARSADPRKVLDQLTIFQPLSSPNVFRELIVSLKYEDVKNAMHPRRQGLRG